jgi:hypothetical protein
MLTIEKSTIAKSIIAKPWGFLLQMRVPRSKFDDSGCTLEVRVSNVQPHDDLPFPLGF